MNINNLELNKKYKNYKILCDVLKEKIKTGKSKQLQFKEWERYFTYHKDGNAFIIDEIYINPKEKIDNRGKVDNYKGIYGKYLDVLIENILFKKNSNVMYITSNGLAELTHMVNKNYKMCNGNRKKFHKYMQNKYKSNELAENDVFFQVNSKSKKAIESSLNRLQRQKKIEYDYCYIIYYDNYVEKKTTILQEEIIINAEKKIMQKMNITNKQKLWKIELKEKFYKKVNDIVLPILTKKDDRIAGYYKGYKINHVNVKRQKNIQEYEKQLNEKFSSNVIKSIKNEVKKVKDKYLQDKSWGTVYYKYDSDKIRVSPEYSNGIESIVKILLSYEIENIKEKV
ncbi:MULTISPECIES: hypothetical protein [Clostridium]|uniref:hypothetical protein n=1 Tax=Clostridium TaxID=1485 RepID=UPI0008249DA5|nr:MULTISPECIES: hypothetical protein [Clostridium]PJI09957.1 hypothetical protein CUB90_19700 [Clostridium sp. CT7]